MTWVIDHVWPYVFVGWVAFVIWYSCRDLIRWVRKR